MDGCRKSDDHDPNCCAPAIQHILDRYIDAYAGLNDDRGTVLRQVLWLHSLGDSFERKGVSAVLDITVTSTI